MSETRIPEALALLREKGWCKGKMAMAGQHCILGAFISVTPVPGDIEAIQRVALEQYGTGCITVFNDDPTTTFADVERVLEKAALERGGSL